MKALGADERSIIGLEVLLDTFDQKYNQLYNQLAVGAVFNQQVECIENSIQKAKEYGDLREALETKMIEGEAAVKFELLTETESDRLKENTMYARRDAFTKRRALEDAKLQAAAEKIKAKRIALESSLSEEQREKIIRLGYLS